MTCNQLRVKLNNILSLGYKAKRVAELIGVHESAISRYRNGGSLSKRKMVILANVLPRIKIEV